MQSARTGVIVVVACQMVGLGACSSPTKPSVSVASARPVFPTDGTQISYYGQPVTLRVTNGVATGATAVTDTFEVATDPAFTGGQMATKQVSQGANGQTSVTLDQLAASKDYYWRVRSSGGDNPGAVSSIFKFTIGPLLVIQPPLPVQPLSGSFPHKRPTLTVTNAARTGPPATLTYRFDMATDPGFNVLVAGGTVPEGSTQTSFTPVSDLASGATFYWRVLATDTTTGVASGYSAPQGFTTVNPDEGTFRYILTLHLVSANKCSGWTGYPVDPYPGKLADIAFDAALVVSGDHLRYAVSDPIGRSLVLDIERTGSHLSGTLRGEALYWPGQVHLGFFSQPLRQGPWRA
jgi:hypothetical protein